MFDIGWGEMVVIGIVALIAIGPKELPTVLRTLGQWTGKIRRMAGEFQGQFQEALREAEISDLKKQFDDAASSVNSMASGMTGGVTTFDPVASAKKEIESAFDTYSDASSKPAVTPPTDSQIPNEATPAAVTPPTSEAVSLPPPEAPVVPQVANIDIPVPEAAPLDPALTPSAETPPVAKPPKEAGA